MTVHICGVKTFKSKLARGWMCITFCTYISYGRDSMFRRIFYDNIESHMTRYTKAVTSYIDYDGEIT